MSRSFPKPMLSKPTLGIIGVGAFGEFMLRHVAPYFRITLYDAQRDLTPLAKDGEVTVGDLAAVAACSIIVLAVSVQKMEAALGLLAPLVKPGTLVLDVGSVKVKPTILMQSLLPPTVDVIGLHPLFGPQSGKKGIEGLNVAVCAVRGERAPCVTAFLGDVLKLKTFPVTAEEHDRELAYVHGLTHMLAKVIVALDLPAFRLTTKTYDLLHEAVEYVRYDSDELFLAIERENPFSADAKKAFFAAARALEDKLMGS